MYLQPTMLSQTSLTMSSAANTTDVATETLLDTGATSVFDGHEIHITIITVLYSIIATTGMLGNILTIVAVALSRKLHTATNAFVVNLSVFDFWTCFALPFQAVGISAGNGWPLSPIVCKMVAGMAIITQPGSVITLALIGINRYILITKTSKLYRKVFTRAKMAWMIAFTWLFPLLSLVGPQLIPGNGGLGYSHKYKVCLWDTRTNSAMILQSIGAMAFFLSTLILIFCYTSIYRYVRNHFQDMMRSSTDHLNTNQLATGLNKRQLQITKNLGLVVIVFFICVLPYTCILLYPTNQVAGIYIAMLFLLPSTINPVLYAAKHPHFKVVFRCMFRCHYSEIPQPSRSLKRLLKPSSARSQISLKRDIC